MLGFINIYKPSGMTSTAVVKMLKKRFHIKKIGHFGTLDPLACGILPIAIGKATRLFNHSLNKSKRYIAVFDFGYTTDTLDITGTITNEGGIIPTCEDINFVIWDDNNMMLKDFVQDWKLYDDESTSKEINFSFANLSQKKGLKFYFNESEFECEVHQNQLFDIKEITREKNTILYPLVANGEVFGLMKIKTRMDSFSKSFFDIITLDCNSVSYFFLKSISLRYNFWYFKQSS